MFWQGTVAGIITGIVIVGALTYRMCIRCKHDLCKHCPRGLRHGQGYVPQEAVAGVIKDIEAEIQAQPQYPNMGKKGCVRRLKELLRPDRLCIYINGGK